MKPFLAERANGNPCLFVAAEHFLLSVARLTALGANGWNANMLVKLARRTRK